MKKNLLDLPIKARIEQLHYRINISWRNGTFVADEPINEGGQDLGPDPYTLLLSSLAACTLATLRMYADRKEWNISQIGISLNMSQEKLNNELCTHIERQIEFDQDVPEDQRKRLIQIAESCPVSKILKGEINISTQGN